MQLHEFLGQVQYRAKLSNVEEALRASRATLETLSERLSSEEPAHLGAQLPNELADSLMIEPSRNGQSFSSEEFLRRVSEREGVDLSQATCHTRVVLGVLREAVSPGEVDDIRSQLPGDYENLFTTGSPDVTRPC